MALPGEDSTFCRCGCGVYNVEGYDEGCLSNFINFILKKGVKEISEDDFNDLWNEFIESKNG